MTTIERLEFVAKKIGAKINATYPDIDGNWMVNFRGAELSAGAVLISSCGRGETIEEAARNYLDLIDGQTLVFNAGDPDRRREMFVMLDVKYGAKS